MVLAPDTPVLRDPVQLHLLQRGDRQDHGRLLRAPRQGVEAGRNTTGLLSFGTLPEDWEHVGPIFERSIHRVPAMGRVQASSCSSMGPRPFTPDGVYYLGESPEIDGCLRRLRFQLGGDSSPGPVWVGWAPGRLDRRRSSPYGSLACRHQTDPSRFRPIPAFLATRGSPKVSGSSMRCIGPSTASMKAPGDIKKSPIHDRLDAAATGPCSAEMSGWERPNWYARPTASQATLRVLASASKTGSTTPVMSAGPHARRVALLRPNLLRQVRPFDGPDAAETLSWMSRQRAWPWSTHPSARWSTPNGCNDLGAVSRQDLTVTRLGEDHGLWW